MPRVACHVGVLRTELDPAPVQFFPRSIQQFEPDTRGSLDHYARIGRAIGETTGQESAASRPRLGVAARIIELRRPITNVFFGDRVIVSRSAGVFRPSVEVEIELREWNSRVDSPCKLRIEIQRSVGVNGSVSQSSRAVAAHSAAAEPVQPEVDMFLGE